MEDRPADMIMEKSNPDPHSKLVDSLTSVKSVNKTDAHTLLTAFGTIEALCQVLTTLNKNRAVYLYKKYFQKLDREKLGIQDLLWARKICIPF